MTKTMIALLAFCTGLWGKKFVEQNAAKGKAKREEKQRIRQQEDEATRYFLIKWAFGDSTVKDATPIAPPMTREEVIARLRNRDAAIKLLEAIPVSPQRAKEEYERFINWLDLTDAERELRDAMPMYLLGIWADFSHPHRGTNLMKLLVDNFKLTEHQAQVALDKYYESLP